uniref:Membrane-bound metal-dependent hydrolase n=1 Tax=Geobacter sp. (strain M21) TaxID=443144 RepID=C6E1E4_GEOSM
MSPVTHLLLSWSAASLAQLSRRERILVTLAGVAPDLDGLGLLVDLARRDSLHTAWSMYHHVLGHNITFCLVLLLPAYLLARGKRLMTAVAVFAVFHLHLLADLVGSRAPDQIWTIPYLLPFSSHEFSWTGQWPLNSWQNFSVTFTLILFGMYQGWRNGRSPVEVVSSRGNEELVHVLRARFGIPRIP